MLNNHIGEFAALATAFFWTITALAFTSAGKRIGSLSVNFWRLIVGTILLSFFVLVNGQPMVPLSSSNHAWLWLSLSGFIGIFLGDLFLFKAFTLTGPRVALLIMSSSPIIAAFVTMISTGESLDLNGVAGMFITLFGIFIVIVNKKEQNENTQTSLRLRYDRKGIIFAFLGAIGQATGIVMSKIGMQTIDNPFVATQIRLYVGILGFIVLITALKRWNNVLNSVNDRKAFGILTLGAFFGPFLGISFSLLAVKYTHPSIVQTITSLTPVFIIPFSIFINHEKIRFTDITGAIVAVAGVSLFFLL